MFAAVLASSAVAAGTCPNEALRTGPSAHLPDCRAYEQVTPVDKEGGLFEGGEHGVIGLGPGGAPDVMLESLTAIDGVKDDYLLNGAVYSTARTESGWVTTPLPPSATEYQIGLAPTHLTPLMGWSLDGRGAAWLERGDSQPDNRLDIVISRPGGVVEDVGPVTPPGSPAGNPTESADGVWVPNVSLSDDASHVLFDMIPKADSGSGFHLWPGDSTKEEQGVSSLYEYVGTGNTTPMLVGVNDKGEVISRCGTYLGQKSGDNTHNAMSGDGDTVFFTAVECGASPAVDELFARVDNGLPDAHTVAISEPSVADCSACDTSEAVLQPGIFEGASEDGSKVFFTTSQPLLEGAKGENIYEYDFDAPAGERLVRVSAGDATVSNPTADVEGVVASSEDGSHIYFVASGALTATPNIFGQVAHTGANNLYVYERDAQYPTGRIAFITDLAESDKLMGEGWLPAVDLTPDGSFMVFSSTTEHLTPDDTSHPNPPPLAGESTEFALANQVFEYDAQTGGLVRVSIGQNGYNDNGNTDFAHVRFPHPYFNKGSFEPTMYWGNMSVSADGSYVFFQSTDGLTPQAFNNKVIGEREGIEEEGKSSHTRIYEANIYEYHDGDVSLISDGRDVSGDGFLLGTDESGGDVFFTTADQLVPQDVDTDVDIYDARVDGGFPAPAVVPECSGDGCQGPLSPAPTLLAPGSEFQAGAGNVAPVASSPSASEMKAKAKAKKKKKKKKRKQGVGKRGRRASRASTGVGSRGNRGGVRS